MDWNRLTDEERLVAKQAVAMLRMVEQAGDTAETDRGVCGCDYLLFILPATVAP